MRVRPPNVRAFNALVIEVTGILRKLIVCNYHPIKIARMDILMILLNYTSMIVIVVAFLLAIYKHTYLSS